MNERRQIAFEGRELAATKAAAISAALLAIKTGSPQEITQRLGEALHRVKEAVEWDAVYLTTRNLSPDVEARLRRLDELTD